MFERVTDENILKQLNSDDSNSSKYEKVTDKNVLKQLNSESSKQKFPIPEFNLKNQVGGLDLLKSALIGMGKGGQNINESIYNLLGKKSPVGKESLDIRKVFRGKENPSVLENLIESTTQYSPLLSTGGMGALPSIGTGALYGATQNTESPLIGAAEGGIAGSFPFLPKVFAKLNPLQLTSKNIAKDILASGKKVKEAYSGEQGHYRNLFKEARESGHGTFSHINKPSLNLDTLVKYTPNASKKLESLIEFNKNPSLEMGQKSISEIGHIIRPLEKKTSLAPFQKKHLEAALEAKQHIQENMFKNRKGDVNLDLLNKHNQIQHGYSTEVVPYAGNKAIKQFKKGEISAKQLINKLKSNYPITSKHGQFRNKEILENVFGSKISKGALLGTGLGAGGALSYKLINDLLGNKD